MTNSAAAVRSQVKDVFEQSLLVSSWLRLSGNGQMIETGGRRG